MVIRLRSRKRDQHGRFLYLLDWDREKDEPQLTGDQDAAFTFRSADEARRVKAMCASLFDYDAVFGAVVPTPAARALGS